MAGVGFGGAHLLVRTTPCHPFWRMSLSTVRSIA
jgi:hypothetical protein